MYKIDAINKHNNGYWAYLSLKAVIATIYGTSGTTPNIAKAAKVTIPFIF